MSYSVWGETYRSSHPKVRHLFARWFGRVNAAKCEADRCMNYHEGFDRVVVEDQNGIVVYVVESLGEVEGEKP